MAGVLKKVRIAIQNEATNLRNCSMQNQNKKNNIFHFQTTGLTGLAVSANPHYYLTALYGKILRAVSKMPQDAAYRKYTEQIVNDRLKAVQNVSSYQLLFSLYFTIAYFSAQRH